MDVVLRVVRRAQLDLFSELVGFRVLSWPREERQNQHQVSQMDVRPPPHMHTQLPHVHTDIGN